MLMALEADESAKERAAITGLRTIVRERLAEASKRGPSSSGYLPARDAAWRLVLEAWGREVELLKRDISA